MLGGLPSGGPVGYRKSWGPRSRVGAALDFLVKKGTELSALRGACGWQGGQGCLWFTSAPQCLRQEGGGAGRSDWLPGLFPRLAPSHARLFVLPREEVAGRRGGGYSPAALGEPPQAFPARGASGPGGVPCRPGFRVWGSCTLPAFLPASLRPPSKEGYASRCQRRAGRRWF